MSMIKLPNVSFYRPALLKGTFSTMKTNKPLTILNTRLRHSLVAHHQLCFQRWYSHLQHFEPVARAMCFQVTNELGGAGQVLQQAHF